MKKVILAGLFISTALLGHHAHAESLETQKQSNEVQLQQLTHKIKQESAKEHVKTIMTGAKKNVDTQLDLKAQRLNVRAKLDTLSKEIITSQEKAKAEADQKAKEAEQKAKDDQKAKEEQAKQETKASNAPKTASTASIPSVQEASDQLCESYHLTQAQKHMWSFIIDHESGWNPTNQNPASGAYGLGQALPAGKMAPYGDDYMINPKTQLKWMYAYMTEGNRYGSIEAAYNFWLAHNWY